MRLLIVLSFLISASAIANVYENVKVRQGVTTTIKSVKAPVKAPVR